MYGNGLLFGVVKFRENRRKIKVPCENKKRKWHHRDERKILRRFRVNKLEFGKFNFVSLIFAFEEFSPTTMWLLLLRLECACLQHAYTAATQK